MWLRLTPHINQGQNPHHLARRQSLISAQKLWARLDPIHDEVNYEVKRRESKRKKAIARTTPAQKEDAGDQCCHSSMNPAVSGERLNELPSGLELRQHPGKLKRVIRQEVLQLVHDQK